MIKKMCIVVSMIVYASGLRGAQTQAQEKPQSRDARSASVELVQSCAKKSLVAVTQNIQRARSASTADVRSPESSANSQRSRSSSFDKLCQEMIERRPAYDVYSKMQAAKEIIDEYNKRAELPVSCDLW